MIKLKDLLKEDKNPCWKGYKQVGMKEKDGRQVPNCVPVEEELSEMKVNKSKVDKTYKSVLNHDEMYEVTSQLKKWFNKNIM